MGAAPPGPGGGQPTGPLTAQGGGQQQGPTVVKSGPNRSALFYDVHVRPAKYRINQIVIISHTGSRIFFVGGAGNDQIGWNYTDRFQKVFKEEGISGFARLNESHDDPARVKAGATPWGDIVFTDEFREQSYKDLLGFRLFLPEPEIEKATHDIYLDLIENPLNPGEQLNLAGYSYGSVLQAHVALRLSELGNKVYNLVLIGSPIPSSSELFSTLLKDKNVGAVIRYDIPGDLTSNPSSAIQFYRAGLQNRDPDNKGVGPHFNLARPDDPSTPNIDEGKQTDEAIRQLARFLKQHGVK